MRKLILTLLLFFISISIHAEINHSQATFCEWFGDAAISVAQNRDNGIGEYELIGKYLSESKSYGEQSVVIHLIDRVYGIEKHLNPEKVAFVEQQRCEIASVNFR